MASDAKNEVVMTPNSDLPRVFALMGHGDDLPDLTNRHRVPPGCTFVTIVIHGEFSMDVPKLYAAFTDELIRPALLNPERKEYQVLLNDYFQFGPLAGTSIFVRTEGMEFQNGIAALWCTSRVGEEGIVWKSGIYQLGEPAHPFSTGAQFARQDASLDVPAEIIRQSYEGSLVQPLFDNTGAPITYTYLNLMNVCPGTYYSFACRGVCKPVSEQQLKLVRTASNAQHQKRQHSPLSHPSCLNPCYTVLDKGMKYYEEWAEYQRNTENRDRWWRTIQRIQVPRTMRTMRKSRPPLILRSLGKLRTVGHSKASARVSLPYIQSTKGGTRRRLLTRRSKSARTTLRCRK